MILSILVADYKQRTRTTSFWFTLLIISGVTFLLFPSQTAHYSTVNISGYRGIYNSAWMGATLAMINSIVMPLFSFYLIKNSLKLDRENHCFEILAATPMNRGSYIVGKFLSNGSILLTFNILMTLTAILVQLYQGEDTHLDLIDLVLPQIYFVLPVLLVTASMAVFFETVPLLRKSFGNVAYLYIWMFMFIAMMEFDMGPQILLQEMENIVTGMGVTIEHVVIGGSLTDSPMKTFLWTGFIASKSLLYSVGIYFSVMSITLLMSMLFFRRYEVKNEGRWSRFFKFKKKSAAVLNAQSEKVRLKALTTNLASLGDYKRQYGLIRIVIEELRLLVNSKSKIWLGISLIQIVVAFVLTLVEVRNILLVIYGIWAAISVSSLGNRDIKARVQDIVNVSPYSESSRLFCSWLSGLTLCLLLASGLLIRFILEGEMEASLQLLAAAMFMPALAVSLGRITGTSRAFEAFYVMLWYMGPLDGMRYMDFLGKTITPETSDSRVFFFTVLAAVLLAIMFSFVTLVNSKLSRQG